MDVFSIVVVEMKVYLELMLILIGYFDKVEDDLVEKKFIYVDMDKKCIVSVKVYLVFFGVLEFCIILVVVSNKELNMGEINEGDNDDLKMVKNCCVMMLVK